jgi:hypothetical protein
LVDEVDIIQWGIASYKMVERTTLDAVSSLKFGVSNEAFLVFVFI